MLEMAMARNPAAPDFTGLDVVSETPIAVQGQAYVSAITSWVTERLKEQSQIQKQARLFKEEFGRRGGKKRMEMMMTRTVARASGERRRRSLTAAEA